MTIKKHFEKISLERSDVDKSEKWEDVPIWEKLGMCEEDFEKISDKVESELVEREAMRQKTMTTLVGYVKEKITVSKDDMTNCHDECEYYYDGVLGKCCLMFDVDLEERKRCQECLNTFCSEETEEK